ncbi:MAG: DUF3054 domain-containing protein [Chloroflexi bacterium]|nr:DUF3054 domain-containing protein [Chloroflexota bacterium]
MQTSQNTRPPGEAHPTPLRARLCLVAGDLLVFLLFVVIGRADHKASLSALDVLEGMAPFALAWLLISPWMGAYRPPATSAPRQAWWRILLAALACGAVALLARSWWYGRPMVPSFVAVALAFQSLLLVAWRAAYILVARRGAARPS